MSLYAELLTNIRQISLAASLPSPSDASTKVTLSSDCKTVELRHGSHVSQLTLPAKTAIGATILPIQDRQKGTTAVSWRLPLDPSSHSSSFHHQEALPWSATDLVPSSAVTCRQCKSAVVPSGAVKVWKDLPSENWAEMMEFWHCHKPDHARVHGTDGKADENSLASRGYGASSAIAAQEGVGFVDLTTLLFAEGDCQCVTYSLSGYDQGATDRQSLPLNQENTSNPKNRNLNAFCSSCRAQLGFFHSRTSAVTLLKWQVSCESSMGTAAPDIPECLAATLISTMSRSGSSKSLIMPIPETTQDASQDANQEATQEATPETNQDRNQETTQETTQEGTQEPTPEPAQEKTKKHTNSSASIQNSNTSTPKTALHIWLLNPKITYSTSSHQWPKPPPPPTNAIKILYRPLPSPTADKLLDSLTCDAQEVNLPSQAIGTVLQHLEESNGLLPEVERVFKPRGGGNEGEWRVGLLRRW